MTAGIKDVLDQLRVVIGKLDEAAMIAMRAQVDAEEAFTRFAEAGRGTDHPQMAKAKANAREAADKAGKIARLYAEAAAAYARYINHIAPGTVPERHSLPEALPTGERIVAEAESREARSSRFHRKATEAVADQADGVRRFEEASRDIARAIRGERGPDHAQTGVSTRSPSPEPQPRAPNGQHPIAEIVIAVASVGLAARSITDKIKKAHERKRSNGDQT